MTNELDLDALANEGEPFTFRFDGQTYTLPADLELEVVQHFDDGDVAEGLRLLLGDEQWDAIKASPKVFGVVAIDRVTEEYAKHLGLDSLGGSSASTATSPPTARR